MRPSTALAGFFKSKYSVSCLQTELVVVLGSFHWHQQSRAYNFLYVIPAFAYTVSYQQIKTWSLLSEGSQSQSWEKVWANWNCLSLVTSQVVGTSRGQHTTSNMSYKQMKTLSSFTTRQPIQIWKKGVASVCFVIYNFSCCQHQQGRAYNFLYVI